MTATPPVRIDAVEAALGAFSREQRERLLPLLVYKSVFLGEWFQALVRNEGDAAVRARLGALSRDTLRETIELLDAMRKWEDLRRPMHDAAAVADDAARLQRQALRELLAVKEGSAEAILSVAMRAPTAELRDRLVLLADLDRQHADELRELLGRPRLSDAAANRVESEAAAGAHTGRADGRSLTATVRDVLAQLRAGGAEPVRLLLSPAARRHLRDEGAEADDGTVLGLPADIDFGWRGEAFAVVTAEHARLAELITSRHP